MDRVFAHAEKPLVYEMIGFGAIKGKKSDWDNMHQWPYQPPSIGHLMNRGLVQSKDPTIQQDPISEFGKTEITPGAYHCVHTHWRWTEAVSHGKKVKVPFEATATGSVKFSSLGPGWPIVDPFNSRQTIKFALVKKKRADQIDNSKPNRDFISIVQATKPWKPEYVGQGDDIVTYFSMLYFDKINIINPWAYAGDFPSELTELYEQGRIKFISPRETFGPIYDHIVSESIIADLKDKKFRSYCENQVLLDHFHSWELHRSKFPFKLMDYARHNYYEPIRSLIELQPSSSNRRNLVEVSATAGETILLNQAIFASSEVKATPFTDFKIHHDILRFKMSRGDKDPRIKEILQDYRYIKDARIDLTAVNVIDEVIPSLENVTVYDLLRFRDSHKDSLDRFRTEMGRLATEIETNYWDDNFYQKIKDKVDDEIKPKIRDLKDSTETFKDKLLRGTKMVAKIAPLTWVGTILPAEPAWVGVAAGLGVGSLESVLEYDKSKRSRKKNGLIYLLEAKGIKRSMASRLREFRKNRKNQMSVGERKSKRSHLK